MRILTGSYGALSPMFRRYRLNKAALDAEYDVPEGRIGQVVRQLRRRGELAARRAYWILWLLIFVIFVGLAFYLGLPFWQQYADGRTQTLNRMIAQIELDLAALDDAREDIKTELAAAVDISFVEVSGPVGHPFLTKTVIGNALYLTDRFGTIMRSDPDATTFELLRAPDGNPVTHPVEIDGALFVANTSGEIFRQTNGVGRFELVRAARRIGLSRLTGDENAIFATSEEGGILVSRNGGDDFNTLMPGNGEPLSHFVEMGAHKIAVYKNDGAALFMTNDGNTIQRVPLSGAGENAFYPPVIIGQRVYISSLQGAIYRSDDSGRSFDQMRSSDPAGYSPLSGAGDLLFYADDNGQLWRSENAGASFAPVRLGEVANSPVMTGDSVYVSTVNGTILRSTDQGLSFDTIKSPDGVPLDAPVILGDNIMVTSQTGRVLKSFFGLGDAVRDLTLAENKAGDVQFLDFLSLQLPAEVRAETRIDTFAARLNNIIVERSGLNQVLENTVAERDRLKNTAYAVLLQDQALLTYRDYLSACRKGATPDTIVALAETCEESWRQREAAQKGSWWQTIASQVPPGILLLFLLATLSALYRYNMRLAGFHHARADTLSLWADGTAKGFTADDIAKVSSILAADMVEFGKTSVDWGGGNITIENLGKPK